MLKKTVLALRRIRARATDLWLGINTIDIPSLGKRHARYGDSVHYEAPDYVLLWWTFRRIPLAPSDVVYEIGCGMGRVVCFFARQHVARVVGIEVCSELVDMAVRNASELRGVKAPVEVRTGDAAVASYDEGTLYFLFNPFGADTLASVLERIRASIEASPRTIRVVYMNPLHDDVIERAEWLRRVQRIEVTGFRSATCVWESF